MQSVVKLSEAGNIYNLNDRRNTEEASESDHSEDNAKVSAAIAPGNKEGEAFGNLRSAEAEAKDRAPAAPSSGPDDALAWLKIIQNATADLTADIRASKREAFAHFPEEAASSGREPPVPPPNFAGRAGLDDDARHDDFSDERRLAQKLSYRYSEPRRAPPQTLRAAVMPYVAATGLFAFFAGSAAVYLLTGSSSPDVKARAVVPAAETGGEARPALADQPSPKKRRLDWGAPASPAESAGSWGSRAEEPGPKSGEPGTSTNRQPQSWSDTVETFKQFVRPEQR